MGSNSKIWVLDSPPQIFYLFFYLLRVRGGGRSLKTTFVVSMGCLCVVYVLSMCCLCLVNVLVGIYLAILRDNFFIIAKVLQTVNRQEDIHTDPPTKLVLDELSLLITFSGIFVLIF